VTGSKPAVSGFPAAYLASHFGNQI